MEGGSQEPLDGRPLSRAPPCVLVSFEFMDVPLRAIDGCSGVTLPRRPARPLSAQPSTEGGDEAGQTLDAAAPTGIL
jgi:hypothetical protein